MFEIAQYLELMMALLVASVYTHKGVYFISVVWYFAYGLSINTIA